MVDNEINEQIRRLVEKVKKWISWYEYYEYNGVYVKRNRESRHERARRNVDREKRIINVRPQMSHIGSQRTK